MFRSMIIDYKISLEVRAAERFSSERLWKTISVELCGH